MALPREGQLSFSQIATELRAREPFSLAEMGSSIGLRTPFSVSSFYGYTNR